MRLVAARGGRPVGGQGDRRPGVSADAGRRRRSRRPAALRGAPRPRAGAPRRPRARRWRRRARARPRRRSRCCSCAACSWPSRSASRRTAWRRRSRPATACSPTSSRTASASPHAGDLAVLEGPDGEVLAKRVVARRRPARGDPRRRPVRRPAARGASPTSTTRASTASSSARASVPRGHRVRAGRQPRRLGGLARLRRDPASTTSSAASTSASRR